MTVMTDQEFISRLWANPHDNGADFIAARDASAERQTLWHSAQNFEARLHRVLHAPTPSAHLHHKLLQIPAQALPTAAANEPSFWQRALPLAACLVLVLSLALRFQPQVNDELTGQIMGHVYAEGRYLTSTATISLDAVNARMKELIEAELSAVDDTAKLNIRFSRYCRIARSKAFHIIIKGENGPVSMMMIPKQVVKVETPIGDKQFSGFITPVRGGTVVVLGAPQEPVRKYINLLNDNMKWKY
jgi:Protein of unknown function (DUF3379)